jgi:hypothetical protein
MWRRVAIVKNRSFGEMYHVHRRGEKNQRASNNISSNYAKRKIWGFHGGDYEEWRLLGCYAVWLL